MTKIQEAVARLKERYGSYRKAEAATGINYAYLQRLATEERTEPSDKVLAVLGLERRVTYVRKGNGNDR
jgi:hypothetical protein